MSKSTKIAPFHPKPNSVGQTPPKNPILLKSPPNIILTIHSLLPLAPTANFRQQLIKHHKLNYFHYFVHKHPC